MDLGIMGNFNISLPSFSISKLAGWVVGIGSIVGAVFAFDARYNNQQTISEIQTVKTEVVSEIAVNRGAMIDMMQGEADDIEFEIMEIQSRGEQPPRYILEKFKRINRNIEKLQHGDTTTQAPSG